MQRGYRRSFGPSPYTFAFAWNVRSRLSAFERDHPVRVGREPDLTRRRPVAGKTSVAYGRITTTAACITKPMTGQRRTDDTKEMREAARSSGGSRANCQFPRAHRKPRSAPRTVGSGQSRSAARALLLVSLLTPPPPRDTRLVPVLGPCGFVSACLV